MASNNPEDATDLEEENKNKIELVLDEMTAWMMETLHALGHSDPNSIRQAHYFDSEGEQEQQGHQEMQDYTTGSSTDGDSSKLRHPNHQFQDMTLWLEDRVIRLWSLDERNQLRSNFWSTIVSYLQALDCPSKWIYPSTNLLSWRGGGTNSDDATLNPNMNQLQRIRVVYWLLSCALSEAYADVANTTPTTTTATTTTSTAIPSKSLSNTNSPSSIDVSPSSFPLGFSTDDGKLDQLLTIIRMKFLLELEEDQRHWNHQVLLAQQKKQEQKQMESTQKSEQASSKKKPKNSSHRRAIAGTSQ